MPRFTRRKVGPPVPPPAQELAPLSSFEGQVAPGFKSPPTNYDPRFGGAPTPGMPTLQPFNYPQVPSSVPPGFNPLQPNIQPKFAPGEQPPGFNPFQSKQPTPALQGVQTQLTPGVPVQANPLQQAQAHQQQLGQAPFNPVNPLPNFAPGALANPFGATPFQTPGLRTPAPQRKARPNMFSYRR